MPGAIVVGIDASTPSRSALEWSVARAANTGAPLELLHVIEDSTDESEAATFVEAELAYARSLDARVPITATVAEGSPAGVLIARSESCSLIVVGTHKTGFIYGRTFGSSFLELGSSSRCDVAFIPDGIGRERRNIVAGVDDSATGDAVILFAAAEAARSSHTLVLVSSWMSALRPAMRSAAAAHRSAMLSRAVELAKNSQPRVRVRTRSSEVTTAEALVEASVGAALLVIGRGPGSTNHDVLLNMSSPVMVVLAP